MQKSRLRRGELNGEIAPLPSPNDPPFRDRGSEECVLLGRAVVAEHRKRFADLVASGASEIEIQIARETLASLEEIQAGDEEELKRLTN